MLKQKTPFILLLCLFSLSGFAQEMTADDEITLIQETFGKDKKMLVDAYMDLPDAVAPSFWTIYQEYEAKRKMLSRERMKIINDYLEEYDSIGEIEADDLAKRTLKNDLQLTKLHSSFYKKFKKATSAFDAAKFLQIDSYIHNTIRNAMQQELPFIDEN
ncbi:hypothetical protein [Algoriphagus machipongonensis]|uniref:Uncharacterized protein n=1 Tax=Algoriphagus machipongonensis TaxID=388413 RepID=A3I1T6_9BACT|nr:hypothetical protein [Algoriphagus machipongonensis]EAZ79752.1 hypothetical protein ALPR1_09008 [Algoriphagus machipongonensis]